MNTIIDQSRKIIPRVTPKNTINSRLKRVRIDTGLSQEGFARVLDVSFPSYRRYELGERDIPLDMVVRLLQIYSLDANWFCLGLGDE